MPRNEQVIRFMAILKELESPQGLYAPRMAERFKVDRRTVYRDLKAVEDAGHPIYQDTSGTRTVWRMSQGYRTGIRDLPVTHGEMLALWYAVTLVSRHAPAPFEKDVRSLIKKVESLGGNGNGFREAASRLFRPLIRGAKVKTGSLSAIGDITTAVIEKRVVKIEYLVFKDGTVRSLRIHPHHLFEYRNGLYVACYSESHDKGITLAVERIRKLELTNEKFELRKGLDPAESHANSIGLGFGSPARVRLQFAKEVAAYVKERAWHVTQVVKEIGDGQVELSMNVCIDYELLGMICGYGPFVTVLKPESLRETVKKRLADALRQYD
ncbi:MAG: transcriptional regulator [Nitrospinae bacterium]|nr:transcriptional regulator [Nitrospinota bacterium]